MGHERTIPAAASAARSRAIADAWRGGPGQGRIAAALAGGPADDAATVSAAAERLFADHGWLDEVLAPLIAALRGDPWFEPPLRVNREGGRSGAILYAGPAATIGLSLREAGATGLPPTIVFSGRALVTKYLRAGNARLARWAADRLPVPLLANAIRPCRALPDLPLCDGAIVRHDGCRQAHLITAAQGDVLTLTATIRVGADPVAREYDRATGHFLRMATNDEGAARAQMLLTVLRAAGAADAAVFDAATRDGAFFLRWPAMREWLACDWQAAWPRLEEMAADDPHPEIRAAAAATRARFARPKAA